MTRSEKMYAGKPPAHAKGGKVDKVAKRKHKFRKEQKVETKVADAGVDPSMPQAEAMAAQAAPAQQAPMPIPQQAEGGSVKQVAPASRMSKMYSPKRVIRSAA